tara:strand:+ start:516 stop:644 length:129 start_codon:yes stop_codon:yes gene_type:complete
MVEDRPSSNWKVKPKSSDAQKDWKALNYNKKSPGQIPGLLKR